MTIIRPLTRPLVRGVLRPLTQRRGGGVALPTTTAMEAWYRKGVGITSAANAVSNWANQAVSGAARDYAQATGAAQPALQGDGTILFNGSSHLLKTAGFTLNQGWTRYLRLKQVTWAAGMYICDGLTGNTGALLQNPLTPLIQAFAGATLGDATLTLNTYASICVVFNGASSVLRVGAAAAINGNAGAANAGGLTIGAAGGGTGWSNIQVAEEIDYSVAHNAAQQDAILAYLNTL